MQQTHTLYTHESDTNVVSYIVCLLTYLSWLYFCKVATFAMLFFSGLKSLSWKNPAESLLQLLFFLQSFTSFSWNINSLSFQWMFAMLFIRVGIMWNKICAIDSSANNVLDHFFYSFSSFLFILGEQHCDVTVSFLIFLQKAGLCRTDFSLVCLCVPVLQFTS